MATVAVKAILFVITVLALWSDRGAAFGPMKPVTNDDKDDKHDYTVEIKKVNMDKVSSKMIGEDTYFTTSLYNETKMTVNGLITMKEDLVPNKVMISIVGSRMLGTTNQWIEKFRQTHEICHFIENNPYFSKEFMKYSNLPTKCPISKGEYYFKNVVINNSEFPKHNVEEAEWRGDVNIFDQATNKPILKLSLYVNVEAIDEE